MFSRITQKPTFLFVTKAIQRGNGKAQAQSVISARALRMRRRMFYSSTFSPQKSPTPTAINFDDRQVAFRGKSTSEIVRALIILKLCSIDSFVNNSLQLMQISEKILGRRLFDFIVRPTFYDQFVAGDDRISMSKTIRKLEESNILPMIACMMEDDVTDTPTQEERKYKNNAKRIIDCIHLLHSIGERSTLQVKITGLMPASLVVKLAENSQKFEDQMELAVTFSEAMLTGKLKKPSLCLKAFAETEKTSLESALQRLATIGDTAVKDNVKLLVDAEFISMNRGLNTLAMAMMKSYNRQRPNVWDTVQCYLKNGMDNLSRLLEMSEKLNVCFGLKIVRGAYMDQERQLSRLGNYPDPINVSYEATGAMYNRVVDLMLSHIRAVGPKCNVVIATHNQNSIYSALKRISELDLNLKSGEVNFAQLYGMSDQITLPLAKAGLRVYKSIPYGTVSETLPYLYRRATENRAVVKGAQKERKLLWKELKCRMTPNHLQS